MGFMTAEQTTAIIETISNAIQTNQPKENWLIPIIATVLGGIVTTWFGVWYARRNKKGEGKGKSLSQP